VRHLARIGWQAYCDLICYFIHLVDQSRADWQKRRSFSSMDDGSGVDFRDVLEYQGFEFVQRMDSDMTLKALAMASSIPSRRQNS
jgi:hypothetical protein